MRAISALVITCLSPCAVTAQASMTHTLMPVPAAVTLSNDRLRLDSGFTIAIAGVRTPRLERAITRTIVRLERRIGVPVSRTYATGRTATLVIDAASAGPAIPGLDDDESYQLNVSPRQGVLKAPSVVGVIRGLETLLQLQDADQQGLYLQGASIHDAPRFRWRGLLLDVSRHFEPVSVIERTLDGMAMVKLNVFHWHLSDDQGFRVESRVFPRLQEFGSDSFFYTQSEIREIVAYAADRGIRVMPEFDVPGHSSAWFVGYPELTIGQGPFAIARRWGTFAPTMDPTRESTYKFLDRFIGEISGLFPDQYWHIGGDEVDPTQWKQRAEIQAWMKAHHIATEAALHTEFNRRLFAIVQKHDRIPVGWNEIFQPGLPTTAVIQSWTGSNVLAMSAKAGFRGILSAPYYIDHQKPASDFYLPDPLPANTDLTPEQQQLVLGGEACMWSEYVTPETIDSRIWPRLAVIAERFWSPASVNDVTDMYRRLDPTSTRLGELGITHLDHSRRMVRPLAGDSIDVFESLLRFVRPRDFGGSGDTQMWPHSGLIDAAVADPRASWNMAGVARAAVAGDTTAIAALQRAFTEMRGLDGRLAAIRDRVPAAQQAAEVAAALKELARVGLESLERTQQKATADSGWRAGSDAVLASVASARIGRWTLRPTSIDAVRVLVDAVSALPPSRRTP